MATLRDVAQLAGVSTATVSNVLNSRTERVSDDTRRKVLSAVRELKYKPTALEKNQKAILTQNLGVMVPDITRNPITRHGYFRNVLDGILEAAMFRGWSVTIFAEKLWDDVGLAVRRSYDGRCDGLIVIAPNSLNETIPTLHERGTPLVFVGSTASKPRMSSVDIDNDQAGILLANHLLEFGHRHFAFLGDRSLIIAACEREKAFRRELLRQGIPEENYQAVWLRDEDQNVDDCIAQWQSQGENRPTAVFVWHDHLAEQFIRACNRAKVRVPQDLSVVGVDDAPEILTMDPSVTSIPQPLHLIGKRAATLLIDRLVEPDLPDEVVRFSVELIPRGSSGPVPIQRLALTS